MIASPKSSGVFLLHALVIALLLIALLPSNPYGYYSVMRWIVCASFIFLCVKSHNAEKGGWPWVWGVAAGIYNPIVPVEATRELWEFVNVITIVIVMTSAILLAKASLTSSPRPSTGYDRLELIRDTLISEFALPDLKHFYGVGTSAFGRLRDPEWKDGLVVKQEFVILFFIPVAPGSFYLVQEGTRSDTYFGIVPFCTIWRCFTLIDLVRIFVGALLKGVLILLAIALVLVLGFLALDFVITRLG